MASAGAGRGRPRRKRGGEDRVTQQCWMENCQKKGRYAYKDVCGIAGGCFRACGDEAHQPTARVAAAGTHWRWDAPAGAPASVPLTEKSGRKAKIHKEALPHSVNRVCAVEGCSVTVRRDAPTGARCAQHGGAFRCAGPDLAADDALCDGLVSAPGSRCAACRPRSVAERVLMGEVLGALELDEARALAAGACWSAGSGQQKAVTLADGATVYLDGFIPLAGCAGLAIEFHGTAFHGHPDAAHALNSRHFCSTVSYESLRTRTIARMRELAQRGYVVLYVWEPSHRDIVQRRLAMLDLAFWWTPETSEPAQAKDRVSREQLSAMSSDVRAG